MAATRLSSKGQVIIPKEIRTATGWTAGTELRVEEGPGGVVTLRRLTSEPPTRVEDLIGCAGYRGPRRSLAQMKAAVAREARKHR